MGIGKDQLPDRFCKVIDEEVEHYEAKTSVQVVNEIPNTDEIPIKKPRHWLRIPDVICVYVDMKNSTALSATKYDTSTASIYRLYTGTIVRLFHEFESAYIDVRGDGAFALFNSGDHHRALAAAVTVKTFSTDVFIPKVKKTTEIEVGSHIGIDQKTVLVRKIGLKRHGDRTDRQNEVWAGRPVNMAAKLASLTDDGEMLVSERYWGNLEDEHTLKTCGCEGGKYTGVKADLWTKRDLSDDDRFDFDTAYLLNSRWCERHGKEFCETILGLDD